MNKGSTRKVILSILAWFTVCESTTLPPENRLQYVNVTRLSSGDEIKSNVPLNCQLYGAVCVNTIKSPSSNCYRCQCPVSSSTFIQEVQDSSGSNKIFPSGKCEAKIPCSSASSYHLKSSVTNKKVMAVRLVQGKIDNIVEADGSNPAYNCYLLSAAVRGAKGVVSMDTDDFSITAQQIGRGRFKQYELTLSWTDDDGSGDDTSYSGKMVILELSCRRFSPCLTFKVIGTETSFGPALPTITTTKITTTKITTTKITTTKITTTKAGSKSTLMTSSSSLSTKYASTSTYTTSTNTSGKAFPSSSSLPASSKSSSSSSSTISRQATTSSTEETTESPTTPVKNSPSTALKRETTSEATTSARAKTHVSTLVISVESGGVSGIPSTSSKTLSPDTTTPVATTPVTPLKRKEDSSRSKQIGLSVGICLLLILVLIVIIVVAWIYWRRKKSPKDAQSMHCQLARLERSSLDSQRPDFVNGNDGYFPGNISNGKDNIGIDHTDQEAVDDSAHHHYHVLEAEPQYQGIYAEPTSAAYEPIKRRKDISNANNNKDNHYQPSLSQSIELQNRPIVPPSPNISLQKEYQALTDQGKPNSSMYQSLEKPLDPQYAVLKPEVENPEYYAGLVNTAPRGTQDMPSPMYHVLDYEPSLPREQRNPTSEYAYA